MLRLELPLASALLAACGSTGDTTSQSSADTTSAAETTNVAATDTTVDTTVDPTAAPTDPTSEGSGTSETPTTAASSTGASDEFCGGWQGADGDLDLTLHDRDNNKLMDGATLPLECGGQGQFMFGLYPTFGGFTPPGDIINFTLTVDVDGYDTNPDGHFYSADPVGYYVGCEPILGGVTGVVPIFPLDNLDDLMVLDGKFAAVHLVLHTGGDDIVRDMQLKLSVVKDDSWAFCGG